MTESTCSRDLYGFELICTKEQLQIRQRCDAKQQERAAKWAKAAQQKQFPVGDKLKKLCRKVLPLSLYRNPLFSCFKSLLRHNVARYVGQAGNNSMTLHALI